MEDNKKNNKNQSKTASGISTGAQWVDCLPGSKDSWRRVYNEDLGCYEVYVRGRHFLVATGINSEADSYIIGMLPALVDLVEKIITEIKDGEVTETTYRGIRYILSEHNKAYRKATRVDRVGLQRRDPVEPILGGRIAEVSRRLGHKIDQNALIYGSRIYFALNTKAEAYWSMVMMYHNVCEFIRSPEVPGEGKASNENNSYKVKIENSLKLKPVMDEIKRLAEDLFKKNVVAEADFNAGKLESEFGEGALEAALREVNNEGGTKKDKASTGKKAS